MKKNTGPSVAAMAAACVVALSLAGAARAADLPASPGTAAPAAAEPAIKPLSQADGPCASLDAKCSVDLATGIKMAYVEVGPADGPALILLHGLTDSARSWAPTMAALHAADPKLHIIAPDQRGHGASSMPSAASCPQNPKSCFIPAYFAADIVSLMNAKNIQKATVAGHSMGSVVAQQLALDRPDRVEKIVLVATSPKVKDNAVVRDYVLNEPVLGSWKKGLEAKNITQPEQVWNATPRDADPNAENWILKNWDVDPVADQAFVNSIVPETAGVKMGTWIGATQALLDFDNTARLAGLTVPTLVLWGTQDSIFYKADQDAMVAALKTSKAQWDFKQYGAAPLAASGAQDSDIGHNVQWDAPQQVAADILSFINTGNPTPDAHSAAKAANGFAITTDAGKAMMQSSSN